MNLLTLKVAFYDPKAKVFRSPSRPEFTWPKGQIVVSACPRHQIDQPVPEDYSVLKLPEELQNSIRNCTCGIWSSPHYSILNDYDSNPNAVYLLMQTYGWRQIVKSKLPGSFAIRSWGAQPIGVIMQTWDGKPLEKGRLFSALHGSQYYEIDMWHYSEAREAIRHSWAEKVPHLGDPYRRLM